MHNDKLKLIFITWLFGAIIAYVFCASLSNVASVISSFIPAIQSYSLATKSSLCEASALWTYGWVSLPIYAFWIFITTDENKDKRISFALKIFFILIFLAMSAGCYYGIYDPYPGTDSGKWATLYSETTLGMFAVTSFLWLGLLSSWCVLVVILKKVIA